MPASPDARRVAFSRFIQRAIDHARATRGWAVEDIASVAGIGRSTVYRWKDGTWEQDPKGAAVKAFCDALDINPGAAYAILWPGKDDRPAPAEPLPTDPDIDTLLRRISDPNVPEEEKYLIRETIRSLAARVPGRGRRGVG